MNRDEEHLKLLAIFHYVVGGLAALFALFPVLHLVMGLIFVASAPNAPNQGGPSPQVFGWLFVAFSSVIITVGLLFSGLILATGRFLSQRRNYTFCLVMAGVECLFMPFGTILGVFTIVVLTRDSAKQLFGRNTADLPV